jgi:anaerobic magnesium-protoporphyrin IX monomethyl ester cyclase
MDNEFSVREISAIFRVHRSTVYRFIKLRQIQTNTTQDVRRYCLKDFQELARYVGNNPTTHERLRILFVNVSLRLGSELKIPPIGLASVMAFVDAAGIPFDVFDVDLNDWSDAVVEAYIKYNHYDVIAFGCIVTHYMWVKWLSHIVKKYQTGCQIIIGNSVGGSCYETLMANAPVDFVVIGEGEETTLELIESIGKKANPAMINGIAWRSDDGMIIKNDPRKAMKKLDDLPQIDWARFFDIKKYIKKSRKLVLDRIDSEVEPVAFPVSTARGCAFRCSFCHFVYWHDPYRYKSPKRIISEIRELQKTFSINYVSFWDDLSFASLMQVERLCDELIKSKISIRWSAAVRADLFGNDKQPIEKRLRIAKKLRKAGCTMVGFSLESADPEILKMMNKHIIPEYFTEQVRLLRSVGIKSGTSVVFGYPIETKETIRKTFQMCLDIGVYPSVGYLLPLPATDMYQYALDNGFILDEDKFLDEITERQDLIINMTSLSDEEIKSEIAQQAADLNLALKLGLKDLLRTKNAHNNGKWKRNQNDVSLDYSKLEFDTELDFVMATQDDAR